MANADPGTPQEGNDTTNAPSTTNYEMHVKTDEKSAAVSDSQAGDASAQQKSTEVKAAAQVEEGTTEGSSPGDVGKLDVHLTYLWQVHRVNYYVGGKSHVLRLPRQQCSAVHKKVSHLRKLCSHIMAIVCSRLALQGLSLPKLAFSLSSFWVRSSQNFVTT